MMKIAITEMVRMFASNILQVMCLMFAVFQRIAPQEEIGIDLHDAYQKVLALHEARKRGAS